MSPPRVPLSALVPLRLKLIGLVSVVILLLVALLLVAAVVIDWVIRMCH